MGEEQVHQVHAELLPLAQGERASDDLLPAEIERRRLSDIRHQEGDREEEREQAGDFELLLEQVDLRAPANFCCSLFSRTNAFTTPQASQVFPVAACSAPKGAAAPG